MKRGGEGFEVRRRRPRGEGGEVVEMVGGVVSLLLGEMLEEDMRNDNLASWVMVLGKGGAMGDGGWELMVR